MLDLLCLNNLAPGVELPRQLESNSFIMRTCQRTLVLSYAQDPLAQSFKDHKVFLTGHHAYAYLLEVICGLKSKLVGENEIVGQFKQSYQNYLNTDFDSSLLQIIEKLFKDAKEIRSKFLIGIAQKTYASIARKMIVSHLNAKHVIVLGSGQLAEDLINQFKKKIDVSICARNEQRVKELSKNHDLRIIDWHAKESLKSKPFIVNSIGSDDIIFNPDFFIARKNNLNKHLFIDLGSPSAVRTDFNIHNGFMSLEDVFKEGAIKEERKRKQISLARAELNLIVEKRKMIFNKKLLKTPLYNSNQIYA